MSYYQEFFNLIRGDDLNLDFQKLEPILLLMPKTEVSRLRGMLLKIEQEADLANLRLLQQYIRRRILVAQGELSTSLAQDRDHGDYHQALVLLDNLRSAHNIGNVIRTAEALGFQQVLLYGYTVGVENHNVKKTSMGTEENIEVVKIEDTDLLTYKNKGYTIYGLETHQEAKDLQTTTLKNKSIVIIGNERFGISSELYQYIDTIVRIPMLGKKASLNVTNAFSIYAYEMVRKNGIFSA